MSNPPPRLSVVVPVYGEAAGLQSFVAELATVLDGLEDPYELVIVDDGSADGTWSVLAELASSYPRLNALRLSRNFGKEAALSAGLNAARGEAVVVMDGDLQHPPALIPEMVRLWSEADIDVVEAVKERRGSESVWSRWRAGLFYGLLDRLSGYDLRGASDFKLMDRRVVEAWQSMGERALFFRGMIAWLGFRHAQVRFTVPARHSGRSKWKLVTLVRLATNAVTSFSSFPLQFVTVAGLVFLGFSVVLGAQTLYEKFVGHAVDGFTTVILLLLIVGSLLMLSLGIIGSYIARIYEEVKGRPRYVVADMLGKGSAEASLPIEDGGGDVRVPAPRRRP